VRLDSIADKRGAFAHGYELLRRADLERALPIFTELVAAYPELADYHLHFAGVINQRLGHNEAAEAAWSRLLRDYPQSVQVPAAALGLGQLLLHTDRLEQARPLLQTALGAADAATAQGARLALAETDQRSGDVAAAYAGFMQVRRTAVGSTLAASAKQQVLALRAAHAELEPVGADRLEEGRLLIAEHDYTAAETIARQTVQLPEGVDPAEALRLDADALYGLGNVDGALARLRVLADHYPHSPAAPAALFRLASIRWNRDDDTGALQAFEEFRRRYPRDRRASETLYAIGRIHERASRSRAAIASYAELARRYPRNKLAGEAQWRIGWIHYVARNWIPATTAFAQLAGRTRSQRGAAEYWEARSFEHAGQTVRARALYQQIIDREPTDYYAAWAEQRLAGTSNPPPLGAGADLAVADAPPSPIDAGPPPATERFHLQRSDELRAAGVASLARGELAAVDRSHRHDPPVMRYLLHAYPTVDGWAAAMRLLHRLGDDADLDASQRERLLYPLAFWANVSHDARAAAVDPLLVVALMRQESLFDPEARSSANAYGLMQLLPSTARRVARSDHAIDGTALMEPELNIQLGTTYLGTLLARFGGDALKAVAAYNGGEAAVEKWQRRFPDLDADEFVESISYRETRDYVKRVISNYRKYRQLYGAS